MAGLARKKQTDAIAIGYGTRVYETKSISVAISLPDEVEYLVVRWVAEDTCEKYIRTHRYVGGNKLDALETNPGTEDTVNYRGPLALSGDRIPHRTSSNLDMAVVASATGPFKLYTNSRLHCRSLLYIYCGKKSYIFIRQLISSNFHESRRVRYEFSFVLPVVKFLHKFIEN